MKKYLFIITLCLLAIHSLSQQPTDPLQAKYWYYRYRLTNDFMVKGSNNDCRTASGYSIPASQIAVTNIDRETKEKSYTNIQWGDATSSLGFYMGVLATEFRLLANNHQPVDAVLDELRGAMLAYERLDKSEERLYSPDHADSTVNGFFGRDDVSDHFFTDNPSFYKKYDFDTIHNLRVERYSSDYLTGGGSRPSQDQVAYLFMGFALVKKCLGDISYQGYNFSDAAKLYTKKIISWIETCKWHSKLPNGDPYAGYFNYGNQWGIVKAAEAICNEKFDYKEVNEVIMDEVPYIHVPMNVTPVAIAAWNDIGDPFSPFGASIMDISYVRAKDYTTSLIQCYAAIGSSWQYGMIANCKTIKVPKGFSTFLANLGIKFTEANLCGYSLTFPGSTVPLPITINLLPKGINPNLLTVDVTALSLAKYGKAYHQEIYYLLHRYLHDKTGNPKIKQRIFNQILASAPSDLPCYKPYYDPSGKLQNSEGTPGWWACNRWVNPQTAYRQTKFKGFGIAGKSKAPFYEYGIFTGLDYMLLHNLYLLTFGTISPFQNTFDKTITSIENLESTQK
jgi:hypothetical protein